MNQKATFELPTGYVDQCNKFEVSGWAAFSASQGLKNVRIVQQGFTWAAIRPNLPAPDVIAALGLDPNSVVAGRWKIPFPLIAGLVPDLPFSVNLDDGKSLIKGNDLQIPLIQNINHEARNDLHAAQIMIPTVSETDKGVSVKVSALRKESDPLASVVCGSRKTIAKRSTVQVMNLIQDNASVVITLEDFIEFEGHFVHVSLEPAPLNDERYLFHQQLRSLWIPKTVLKPEDLLFPTPPPQNIERVSGANSQISYLTGGATTFMQLNQITNRYFDRNIDEFDRVVDWGSGCARVTRHFWETGPVLGLKPRNPENILGLDIDPVNVEWSQRNLGSACEFEILSLDGFDLEDNTVDMLFGISVMTHLTEMHQFRWLKEIARIVKPGGCVILTIHGEFSYYRHARILATPFIEKFGFYDGTADTAIGAEREDYYRATYHSRTYIKKHWSDLFEIMDVIPVANAFHQDFVVLRRVKEQ